MEKSFAETGKTWMLIYRHLNLTGLVLLVCFFPQVHADTVTPSERVETRLRARAAPTTESGIVGFIQPGESAELIGSVPRWYEIRLSDSITGFVSKSWSVVIPESETQLLRVGGWNIKKLGHNNGKDFALVAQIIKDNFDFLVIIEVMQKQGGHPGYDSLVHGLGSGWNALVTSEPRPNTTSGHSEFYAMVFRSSLVNTCPGADQIIYVADNNGGSSGSGVDVFSREPAFGCFRSENFDFVVAAYHARWANGNSAEIIDEVDELNDVFQEMGAVFPGEKDLLIIGDFNLVPEDLMHALGVEAHVVGTGSTLNDTGVRTQNLYDHMLIHDTDETAELVGSGEVLDVRSEAVSNLIFFQTVSDHLPIRARFKIDRDDDD